VLRVGEKGAIEFPNMVSATLLRDDIELDFSGDKGIEREGRECKEAGLTRTEPEDYVTNGKIANVAGTEEWTPRERRENSNELADDEESSMFTTPQKLTLVQEELH